MSDRLTLLKQDLAETEIQLSAQLQDSGERVRRADLATAELKSKLAKTETEIRSRENVS